MLTGDEKLGPGKGLQKTQSEPQGRQSFSLCLEEVNVGAPGYQPNCGYRGDARIALGMGKPHPGTEGIAHH
jgi:hypothetical protein